MLLSKEDQRYRREAEIDREARSVIQQHGSNAVYVALNQLNQSIDRRERNADFVLPLDVDADEVHQAIEAEAAWRRFTATDRHAASD